MGWLETIAVEHLGCDGTARAGAKRQTLDTLLTGGRLDSLKSGEPVAGSARSVPDLWSAAVQCGFSSLADFSRKVSGCQLHPSLQQKFLTRGQGRERGEGA